MLLASLAVCGSPSPALASDVFFLHHSTGRNLLAEGGVRAHADAYSCDTWYRAIPRQADYRSLCDGPLLSRPPHTANKPPALWCARRERPCSMPISTLLQIRLVRWPLPDIASCMRSFLPAPRRPSSGENCILLRTAYNRHTSHICYSRLKMQMGQDARHTCCISIFQEHRFAGYRPSGPSPTPPGKSNDELQV